MQNAEPNIEHSEFRRLKTKAQDFHEVNGVLKKTERKKVTEKEKGKLQNVLSSSLNPHRNTLPVIS